MRINLQCPYQDKDYVKNLGAKWDSDKKVWYIRNPISLEPFSKWLSEEVIKNYKPKKKKVSKKKEVEPHVRKFQRFMDEMDQHMRSI